ncbi:MAG: 2-oxoacid:acceptor oxidoreductase family protein [bacterium]|nr:2-oxoacid:acceptor oxidoreductase family protein [bacterium]
MATLETKGMFDVFTRSGSASRMTHYCAGCGHGIVHKLLSEAYVELGLQDRVVIVNPIGCAVFGYYYWDVGNVSAGHGQAPSMATAISRLKDKAITISYQGDGDLAAIGLSHTLQAAARGEHMAVFFVNNSIYGMTGGQMAPTTLVGQKTTTSPLGRNPETDGMPLHMAELVNTLDLPVYIERVSVADTARIMKAKRAIRKALEIQRDRKGYTFVEILSPCPTSCGKAPMDAAKFVIEQMEKEYPLGCLRDNSAEAKVRPEPKPWVNLAEFFGDDGSEDPVPDATGEVKERRFKFTGFGGQGILSLGLVVADAARAMGLETTWLPSYGPEQRGGDASCTVVTSTQTIGSPAVENPDLLVVMNQAACNKHLMTVRKGGLALVDATVTLPETLPEGVRIVQIPAIDIAAANGMPKAANVAILGGLSALDALAIPEHVLIDALKRSFAKKPTLVDANIKVFSAAIDYCRHHGLTGELP